MEMLDYSDMEEAQRRDRKRPRKVIVAGGRNYKPTDADVWRLNDINIVEIVSGCAAGADRFGEGYAGKCGIPVKRFPADWATHGRAAGPIRNRQMAEYADAVVLFPGGRGTLSMKREAERAGIAVFDYMNG